jgi:hypothetical protein
MADVPTLLFKLVVLFVAAFFGWQLGKMLVRALWSVVEPVLWFVWRVVTAPIRLPWQGLKRLYRPIARRRRERRWQREQAAEAERVRLREQEEARRHAEALEEVRRVLDVD